MFELDLEKVEEPEIKLPTSAGSLKKQERLRRGGKNAQLSKNYLNDPDNPGGVVTYLEVNILECDVKWTLGSITINKTSGSDEIPAELFQILKNDAVKVLHSICQQIWKTWQWPQDWKRSVFSCLSERQCQRVLKLLHNCTHFTS